MTSQRALILWRVLPLFGISLLLPAVTHGERRAVCKRACVQAIHDCAAARSPMKLKKATRQCRRQLIRACRDTGTVACETATASSTTTTLTPGTTTSTSAPVTTTSTTSTTAPNDGLPHFRGDYTFTGVRSASTCPPLAAYPEGEYSLGLTILNGGFGTWLDGLMNGTVDAEGERKAPPWWMRSVHDCIDLSELPSGVTEWCAAARLTVDGFPPATPSAPPPPAAVVFTVEFYAPLSQCTVTYTGALRRDPPGG
jgi:hypothetical protein